GLITVYAPYLLMPRGRGGLVVRCRRRSQRVPSSKDSTEDSPCMWSWRRSNIPPPVR
ncbi:hypothetical protein AVEN_71284-1, partial [Araneus ventricosus]